MDSTPAAYQILFENKPEATAPAHEVVITDQFDLTRFDLSTLSFGPVSFGDFVVRHRRTDSRFLDGRRHAPTRNVIVAPPASLDTVTVC